MERSQKVPKFEFCIPPLKIPQPVLPYFKATMFLTGFIFGSLVVYLICLEEKEKEILPMWANTLIAVSAGKK